jgi:predicted Zn-dependent protease
LWWSERQVERAARIWPNHPTAAFNALDTARSLNPFGDHADLVRGAIAVQLGSLPRADAAFANALKRNPRNEYAALERGAIAGTLGDRATAIRWLTRAVALSPRDAVAKDALAKARAGRRLNVAKTNLALARQASSFAKP